MRQIKYPPQRICRLSYNQSQDGSPPRNTTGHSPSTEPLRVCRRLQILRAWSYDGERAVRMVLELAGAERDRGKRVGLKTDDRERLRHTLCA